MAGPVIFPVTSQQTGGWGTSTCVHSPVRESILRTQGSAEPTSWAVQQSQFLSIVDMGGDGRHS